MSEKKELTAQYQQSSKHRGEHSFEIFNKRFLRINHQKKKAAKRYALDMVVLNPEASLVKHYTWHWLIASGVSALVLLIMLAIMYFQFSTDSAIYLIPLSILSLALAVLCARQFLMTSEKKRVFYTRFGQVPIAEFVEDKSDPKSREQFLTEMKIWIDHCTQKAGFSAQELRAGELKTLRRLVSDGAISEADYENARERILTH